MNDNLVKVKEQVTSFWTERSKRQKGILVSSVAIVVLVISIFLLFSSSKFVPLYNDLSLPEIGQIKEELDVRNISYEVANGGTTIKVPEDEVDTLLVDLASQGIPDSGRIDYSYFSQNASWGITDNEFNIMKLDAMQNELAKLIEGIDGIRDANVMINMPEESLFVNESDETASAAITLHVEPGYEFEGNQIDSLYHLVSKAVPNLPRENIGIINQYFEDYADYTQSSSGSFSDYTYQQTIKKDIEKDIQRRLQQMLGAMIGLDKVIVSVTTDIDFSQENRIEELVDPVDLENMEGLPVSIETIQETYSGNQGAGGVVGMAGEDIPQYEAVGGDGDGEYELVKEMINNEFNRIHKEIVESPYKIRDLGVQVAIDSVVNREGDDVQYLSQLEEESVEEGIISILNSIISTSIDKQYGEIIPEEKTSIVFQEFTNQIQLTDSSSGSFSFSTIPLWIYIVGGLLFIAVIGLIVLLMRNRTKDEEVEYIEEVTTEGASPEIPDISEGPSTEADVQMKQLESMAKSKPEEFAKLLRSWISDD